jgi:hypothetical protein
VARAAQSDFQAVFQPATIALFDLATVRYNMTQRRIRVKINLPVLIGHLTREEGRHVSEADTLRWLEDAGFARKAEHWIANEADLGQLDPSEVLEVFVDVNGAGD